MVTALACCRAYVEAKLDGHAGAQQLVKFGLCEKGIDKPDIRIECIAPSCPADSGWRQWLSF